MPAATDLDPDVIIVVVDWPIAVTIMSVDSSSRFKSLRFGGGAFGSGGGGGSSFPLSDRLPTLFARWSMRLWMSPVVFAVTVTAFPLKVCTRFTFIRVVSENWIGSGLGAVREMYIEEALLNPLATVSPK